MPGIHSVRKYVRPALGKTVATAAAAAAGAVLLVGCGHTTPTAAASLTAAAGTQPATIAAVPPPVVRLSPEPPPAAAPAVSTAAPTSTVAGAPAGTAPLSSTPAGTARPAVTTLASVAAPSATTNPLAPAVSTSPARRPAALPTTAPTPTSPRPPSAKRTAAATSEQGKPAGGAVSDPQYSVDKIDRTAAQQVAWAYLRQRLSYSWHDSHAGDGIRRAARYTTPAKAAALLADLRNNSAGTWTTAQTHRVQASVTVRRMQWAAASSTGGSVAVVVYFTRTFGEADTIPTTTAGNTTLTLTPQSGGAWAVSADNFGTPD